jgi:hypothetical protein
MRKLTYDRSEAPRNIAGFQFRDLHPKIFMGTASDRYAGGLGKSTVANVDFQGNPLRKNWFLCLRGTI